MLANLKQPTDISGGTWGDLHIAEQRHDNVIFLTQAAEQPESVTQSMPTSMRTFRLNYANIPEAAEMVQKLLSPQASRPRQRGKIWDADFVMALSKALRATRTVTSGALFQTP
jgi:hypothetical protein